MWELVDKLLYLVNATHHVREVQRTHGWHKPREISLESWQEAFNVEIANPQSPDLAEREEVW